MDIALIIGVILGLAAMIGSIAYALFVEGSAGGFGNFLSAPSFGIVFGGMIASIFVDEFPGPTDRIFSLACSITSHACITPT